MQPSDDTERKRRRIRREVEACQELHARGLGEVTIECGFRITAESGVFPPSNRVTRLLAGELSTRCGRTALDLGCGSGLLAMVASRRFERVWATDISHRAVSATSRNARLNGIGNAEAIGGDMFDAVHGLRFDLIVANPPLYDDPEDDVSATLASAVLGCEAFLRRMLQDLFKYLEPEGEALFVTSSLSNPAIVERWVSATHARATRRRVPANRPSSQDLELWSLTHPPPRS